MSQEQGTLRSIAWRELFPWLSIFRSFRISVGFSVLTLATMGVLVTPLGWLVSQQLFVSKQMLDDDPRFHAIVLQNRNPYRGIGASDSSVSTVLASPVDPRAGGLPAVFQDFVVPLQSLYDNQHGLRRFAYFLFGYLWMLVVWSCAAGAITRIAVVRLAREERVGLKEAVQFSIRRFGSYFASPILPQLFMLIFVIPMALLGLLMLADWGLMIAGLFWLFVLIGALIIGILLLGLIFGWPLMWVTISAEGSDSFDALSRSYAYTFQRPLHYLFYALVAVLFGALSWLLVDRLSEKVIDLANWGTSWGANAGSLGAESKEDRVSVILQDRRNAANTVQTAEGEEKGFSSLRTANRIIRFWEGLIRTIKTGFMYALFWSTAAAIYLLLRRDVDETEMDEVYIEGEEPTYGLPEVNLDAPSDESAKSESESQSPSESSDEGDQDR